MGSNVIFFGWDRALPGRERISAEHFQDFVKYLGGLQQKGSIQSFETVFLNNHGGDMNGFFLIRGATEKLDTLISSEDWQTHMMRAALHLQSSGVVRGRTGDLVMKMMETWTKLIPA